MIVLQAGRCTVSWLLARRVPEIVPPEETISVSPPPTPTCRWQCRRLRRARGGFHGFCLRQLPAFAPALTLRGSDHASDGDIGVQGLMNEAPGSRLLWWQRRQLSEVEAAAFPHAARGGARHGIEPHGLEWLPAHPAKSCEPASRSRPWVIYRFHGHLLHMLTPAGSSNMGLFATAAAIFLSWRQPPGDQFRPTEPRSKPGALAKSMTSNPVMNPDIEVTAGDDWAVTDTLLDIDGSPLDLTYPDRRSRSNARALPAAWAYRE